VSKSATQSAPARRLLWRIAVLTLALAGLAFAAGKFGLRQAQVNRVRATLPTAPATASNDTLRDMLADARKRAESGRLEDVAELGRLYHANEFRREAEVCWRLLIREQPREARWTYYLADLLRTAGEQTAVEELLTRTVAADPSVASAWLQLAEMKLKQGRLDAAAADYRRRIDLLPDDPYAQVGLARIAQQKGRPEETLQRLERLLGQHPQFSTAHNLYAELQAAAGREDLADHHRWLGQKSGRFREADNPWMRELNERCHDPRRLLLLSVIAAQTGPGDRGQAGFEKAIALDPGFVLAYEKLGSLLLEQGNFEAARDVLLRGLDQAKDGKASAFHYHELFKAFEKLRQLEQALHTLEVGLRQHPDSPELLYVWGNWFKAEGRLEEAAAAYRRAIKSDPAFVEADYALATLLLDSGRRQEAVEALNRALRMQPTFPKALLLLARLEEDEGRVEEAGRYLLPLLKANPGLDEVREVTAIWRLRAGRAVEKHDPPKAERHYRAGLALRPDDPELNAALGVLLLLGDRPDESLGPLEIFHRARPTQAKAAFFLGMAYARTGRVAAARQVLTAGRQLAELAGDEGIAARFREILSRLP